MEYYGGVSIRVKVFNATFDNISVISGAVSIFGGEHQSGPEKAWNILRNI